jgi:lipopolysaccharide assembly protein A
VRLVYWGIVLLIGIVLAVFAVTNREPVAVVIWPLAALDMPLFAAVLAALLIGFLLGAFAAWAGGRRVRRLAKWRARRIDTLERDLAQAEARAGEAPAVRPHS